MTAAKIRALVVDDEPLARKFIRRLLKDEPAVEVVGECGDGRQAVAAIHTHRPDLVFLDIQMPELDGLAALEAVAPGRMPQVIFTTAYEQYALRAFELHALDYLLKPFDQARFMRALQHAKERLGDERARAEEHRQVAALLENIKERPRFLERLFVKAEGRIVCVRADEIDWLEADDKYVHLHAGRKNYMVRQTLSGMEAQLDPQRFLRIHRSALVNVERIAELRPLVGGEHTVLLTDGTELTLSRTYKDRLFALLGKPL
jgi:two-component system LytT family response regulator